MVDLTRDATDKTRAPAAGPGARPVGCCLRRLASGAYCVQDPGRETSSSHGAKGGHVVVHGTVTTEAPGPTRTPSASGPSSASWPR
jgi:hypothetical protein